MIIAEYKFNNSTDTLPTFNHGVNYTYTYEDVVEGEITTRTIYSDSLPTTINFISSSITELIYLDISNITNFTDMFHDCNNLVTVNASDWDTSRVTNMCSMFNYCHRLTNIDVSNWDTSQVTDMSYMFSNCNFNLTSLDLSNWDTSKVTDMSYMFDNCTKLTSVNMNNSDVYSINDIIEQLPTRTEDNPGTLKTGTILASDCNIETASSKYWNIVSGFTIAIYTFNSGTDTLPTFNDEYTYSYEDIVEEVSGLEWFDKSLAPNTGGVSTGSGAHTNFVSVTPGERYHIDIDYARVFWYDENQNFISQALHGNNETIIGSNGKEYATNGKYAIAPENARYMRLSRGHGDTEIKIFIGTTTRTITSDTLPTSINFSGESGLVSLSYLDTSNVTDMSNMFSSCGNLTSIDLSNFDTSNVTNMYGMFYECSSLTSLNLNSFNTSNVTDMRYMFCYSSLTSIDVSNFNTSNVTSMSYMFGGCTNLTSIDVSNFNTSKVTDMSYMFDNCTKLTSVNMNNSDVYSINDIIEQLPTRTEDNPCTLKTGTILASSCDIETASSKYWNIVSGFTVATYTFNSDTDTLPTFNDEFIPTSEKTESRTIFVTITESTFNIPITSLNDIISIEIPRYEGNAGYQKKVESNSDYIRVEYTPVTSGPYIRIDSTGKCTVGCSEPWDANEDIVIKYKVNGYTYTDVDNGDGTVTRTITSDSLPSSISFIGKTELVSVSYLDTSNVTNMSYMFGGCINLTYAKVDDWNTSKVTDMSYMFYNCQSLTSLDVSSFNTSNVTNMSLMFHGCNNLTSLDVSSFNTSKVTNMYGMFWNCNALTSLDVSSFNTSEVTDMGLMFIGCNNLTSLDVSSFNTSEVTNMYGVFYNCKSLISLDLTNFGTSKVTDMSYMFYNCQSLTSLDVSSFNTSNVTDMSEMFYKCESLTSIDVSGFDTSNVTNMNAMFHDCTSLPTLDLSNWDTGKVTDMGWLFFNCYTLPTLDLSNFDTSNVTITQSMFHNCKNLTELDLSNFDTSKINNMKDMFYNCESLTSLNVSSFDTKNVTDMSGMFYDCNNLTSLNLSSFNTSNVTDMEGMFRNCTSLTSLDLSNFDTSNVTNMGFMFRSCQSLTTIDVSNFNTSNVTSMDSMFNSGDNNPMSLEYLDLSNWDTSKVINMHQMFRACSNLKYLDISNFKINSNCNTNGMFEVYGIENIGMLHCDNYTVNTVANNMHADSTIWVQDTKAYEYEDTNNNGVIIFRDYKEQEIEIDLPQPLRSIGNYKDRLYWDEEKGRYCIEQIIGKGNLSDATSVDSVSGGWSNDEYYAFNVYFPYNVVSNTGQYEITMISEDFISSTEVDAYRYLEYEEFLICRPHSTVIKLAVSRGDINTYNDYMLNYIKSLNTTFYWVMNDPIVIETDITEKLNFDTYNDSMYIAVNDSEVSPSNISTVIAMKEEIIEEGDE